MPAWISRVKGMAFQLKTCDSPPTDKDIILVLTNGLPPSYENFVIQFDATPPELITLNNVITRLRNEDARQEIGREKPDVVNNALAAASRQPHDKSHITCYNCHKLGHYRHECPEKAVQSAPVASMAFHF